MLPVFLALVVAYPATVNTFKTPSGSTVVNIVSEPDAGFVVNQDAPWKLQILDANVEVESTKLEHKIAGYVLEVKKPGNFKYKMQGYFCKKDKSECIRKIFTGAVEVDGGN